MGERRQKGHPRLKRTAWVWVWPNDEDMPIHQRPVQGFILEQRRQTKRDQRGEYGVWWVHVVVRLSDDLEPVVAWVPEHQVRPHGGGWQPPMYPSDRTALFDSVEDRRRQARNRHL